MALITLSMLQIAPNSMFLSILNDSFRGSNEENWMKQVTPLSVRHIYLSIYFHWSPFLIFFPEVSTTQQESSSEEEDERPSSPGPPSDSSDSEDDQGTNCMVL